MALRSSRRRRAAGWLAAALLAAGPAHASELEYKVKAAFLYNFAKFVSWPPEKLSGTDEPLRLCVSGDPALAQALAELVRDKRLEQRPFQVQEPAAPRELTRCHVAYFGSGAAPGAMAAAAGHSVLTVHELAAPDTAGVVRFYLEERRVRFEINTAAAQRERLVISSKLMAVASVARH